MQDISVENDKTMQKEMKDLKRSKYFSMEKYIIFIDKNTSYFLNVNSF